MSILVFQLSCRRGYCNSKLKLAYQQVDGFSGLAVITADFSWHRPLVTLKSSKSALVKINL